MQWQNIDYSLHLCLLFKKQKSHIVGSKKIIEGCKIFMADGNIVSGGKI